jgi:hypothetical protein
VVCVCMKTYSVISDLCLYQNVFCNQTDHSLQNTFSYKHRSLITEYVFIQTQITHYRIRFHTNTDHLLQNTFSYKLRSLITEYVLILTQITHYRIRFHTNTDHSFCVKTYSVMSDLCLCESVFCNEWSVFVWKRIL